jgi:hypothetical protein
MMTTVWADSQRYLRMMTCFREFSSSGGVLTGKEDCGGFWGVQRNVGSWKMGEKGWVISETHRGGLQL